ncbi:RNA-directed DNA polymerase, eukaryota, reverse transcriptase zinc-binding domain protein [Tanacetum coccineum]
MECIDREVLRRLGSIFTLVYAAVQKLKNDSWLELHFSLKVYKAGKRLLYVKRNKAISFGKGASKVSIEMCDMRVWEATVFKKDYATVSDNFITIYGTWISNNTKVLIVVKDKKTQQSSAISSIKNELIAIDKNLDSGNASDEILFKRMELMQQLHDIKQMEARDNIEKSKTKWAIEGDENSKFFHGIINKKCSQMSIRKVFVDGDWKTDPDMVKDAFKDHFAARFKQPANGRLKLNITFTNRLSTEQAVDMNRCGFEALLAQQWLGSWLMGVQHLNSRSFAAFSISRCDGRLTLLKSVLGASPLYNIWIYKVPKGVLNEMEAIHSKFFNGADTLERKIAWVSWDKVLASKKNDSLGVSSFHALNRALLLKWVWHFISQDGSLWYHVIQALYDHSFELHSISNSSLWCFILPEMHLLKSKGFDFVTHCKKRVGDGHCTWFWYDNWFSDQPFRVTFPRLFALEMDKDSTVASKLGSPSLEDKWICDLNGDGEFRVKDVRIKLDDILLPSDSNAMRWVKYIPIKINVFAWRVQLDRLPIKSNLIRRGVILESPLCLIYGLIPEDIHHIIFQCDIA